MCMSVRQFLPSHSIIQQLFYNYTLQHTALDIGNQHAKKKKNLNYKSKEKN